MVEAIFLGVVQGLTEFLPVSSSGHLALFQHLFGLKEPILYFDVALHAGTLAAVVIFFWRDLLNLVTDVLAGALELIQGRPWSEVCIRNPQIRFFIFMVIASIPTGFMGFYLKDFFEGLFGSLLAVGFGFWITTILVWLTQFNRFGTEKSLSEMKWYHALFVGIFQGFAIAPGISRSGSTISSGLFCSIERELAARFSFLLSIPAVLGAIVLEGHKIAKSGEAMPSMLPIIAGTVVAAVVGYL
jgi:undecaprenyl-diphosphatase